MASSLIAILIVLLVGHLTPIAPHLRRLEILLGFWAWAERRAAGLPAPPIALLLLAIALPALLLCLLLCWMQDWAFGFPQFLLSTLVLFLAWGPRDLDLDVKDYLAAPDRDARERTAAHLGLSPLPEGTSLEAVQMVHRVGRAGLDRWFAPLFWFLLLGAPGALVYRLLSWAPLPEQGPGRQLRDFARAIPAHLLALSLAIAAHFDAVLSAWREHHGGDWTRAVDLGFLDRVVQSVVDDQAVSGDGFIDALSGPLAQVAQLMNLLWRALFVWLTVIGAFVLGGWIA